MLKSNLIYMARISSREVAEIYSYKGENILSLRHQRAHSRRPGTMT
jgi:hypothetical protein